MSGGGHHIRLGRRKNDMANGRLPASLVVCPCYPHVVNLLKLFVVCTMISWHTWHLFTARSLLKKGHGHELGQ